MFIRTADGRYPLTAPEIIAAHPNVSFPVPFAPPDGYALVASTAPPAHNPATHRAVEVTPIVVPGGGYAQTWTLVALTAQEIAEREAAARPPVPPSVTRRQARRALVLTGKFDLVQPAIDAIPDPLQRALVRIDWDDAQTYDRDDPTLQLLAGALGFDLDDLFILAGQQ